VPLFRESGKGAFVFLGDKERVKRFFERFFQKSLSIHFQQLTRAFEAVIGVFQTIS
jgi:hypothetical protein